MPLEVASYDRAAHYETLLSWWKGYGWKGVPAECLPTDGVVVLSDGKPAAAAFVYLCRPALMAFVDFVVADPDLPPLTRGRAVHRAVAEITDMGRKYVGPNGFLYSVTGSKALRRAYERAGWKMGELSVSTFYLCFGQGLDVDFLTEDDHVA